MHLGPREEIITGPQDWINHTGSFSKMGQIKYYLISPWTKWPPFHRWHFQVHFYEWKFVYFFQIWLKIVPKGLIDNKPSLVQVMAWHRTGDKPLPEPMMTQFTYEYMRHKGEDELTLKGMGTWWRQNMEIPSALLELWEGTTGHSVHKGP